MKRNASCFNMIIAALVFAGCNRIAGPETLAARRSLSDRVVLLTPNGKSYLAHPFGASERELPVGNDRPISFTPDLQTYAYTEVRSHATGRTFSILLAERGSRGTPLISVPAGSDLPKWKLRWGATAAYPVFVQINDRLYFFCRNREGTVLSDGVTDFDVSADRLWLLHSGAEREALLECRIVNGRIAPVRRANVPPQITGIVALNANELLGFSTAPDLHIKEGLSRIDIRSGQTDAIRVPAGVHVLDVVPIRGTSRLLLDEWRGDERVDGTLLSKVYLLDLTTGQHTWIWTNHSNELLQDRPANAAQFSCTGD